MLGRITVLSSAILITCVISVVNTTPSVFEINASAADQQEVVNSLGTERNSEILSNLTKRLEALQASNDRLQDENTRLKEQLNERPHEKSTHVEVDNFGVPNLGTSASPKEKQLTLLEEQTAEIFFSRQLQVYDYKKDEMHIFSWTVPYSAYALHRNDPSIHGIPTLKGSNSINYYKEALSSWGELSELAKGLRGYAGGDDELYANMVLQITHQFMYVPTDYTKYPIETFVEGTGDCDSLGIFAAALLKAGGVDSALAYGAAKPLFGDSQAIGHALVGVKLQQRPDDHDRVSYSTIGGQEEYYVAEPTWEGGAIEKAWNYTIKGSAVGDMVWKEFSGTIVETP